MSTFDQPGMGGGFPQPTPAWTPPPTGGISMPEQPAPPKGKRSRRKGKEDPTGAEQVTKKVVNKNARFALLLGIVAAAVVGLLAYGSTAPETYVVRVTQDLPAGQVLDASQHLEAVASTDDLAETGAFEGATADAALQVATEEIDGLRVQYPMSAGEQVHADNFATTWATSSEMKPNERLMSISATVSDAVAGQIRAGDRVDIAASADGVAGVVFSDIEVVAVTVPEDRLEQVTPPNEDDTTGEGTAGNPIPGIYTVRVTDQQSSRLYAVDANAELALIYRPEKVGDEKGTQTEVEPMTAKDVICEVRPSAPACASL